MKDGREVLYLDCLHTKRNLLPTELPRLVFGFQKMCGWEGAIDGTHTSSDIVLNND